MSTPVILRFADDLRLADNPAVAAATATGHPVVPVFVDDPDEDAHWVPGPAAHAWIGRSLDALDASLAARGSRLLRLSGDAAIVLTELARLTGADTLVRTRRRWPPHVRADARTDGSLAVVGVRVQVHDSQLLHEPADTLTPTDAPYTVFSPFARRVRTRLRLESLCEPPVHLTAPERWPDVQAFRSPPHEARPGEPDLRSWTPGETGALAALRRFTAGPLASYETARDLPGAHGTSRLSPHLRFGEISPARVWREVESHAEGEAFLRQLLWREFAYDVLEHFPETPEKPLHDQYASFPWSRDFEGLAAWQRGQTGYPLVDAGMRELLATGWMHSRARMVVASFLVKDLLLPWQQGAMWFWRHLADADLANNTLGWQWAAGCGADAAPYVRVFNPVAQGVRFDTGGSYVRRWVPELSALPDSWVHRPWQAPREELRVAGIELGTNYPAPIVDHAEARARALAVFDALKNRPG